MLQIFPIMKTHVGKLIISVFIIQGFENYLSLMQKTKIIERNYTSLLS